MDQLKNLTSMSSNNSKKERSIREFTFWESKSCNKKEGEKVNLYANLGKSPYEDYSDDPLGYEDKDLYKFTKSSEKLAESYDAGEETTFPPEGQQRQIRHEMKQGPFFIKDDFVMLLLHRGVSTKVTTLNRLNYYRTLVFMGNGNGVVAYGKGRSDTP